MEGRGRAEHFKTLHDLHKRNTSPELNTHVLKPRRAIQRMWRRPKRKLSLPPLPASGKVRYRHNDTEHTPPSSGIHLKGGSTSSLLPPTPTYKAQKDPCSLQTPLLVVGLRPRTFLEPVRGVQPPAEER